MTIQWKLTISQERPYTYEGAMPGSTYQDLLILYHDSLTQIHDLVKYIEDMFNTDNIHFKIESVEDKEDGME